ncbi:hypothetical protein PAXRUDRAFT_514483 [Paxillus rubicundulus Ve08.2h10]|uniref:Uncharacterized protein n=1 Tax=Paxillus rubicundulus Ve08.2h10 TaxID=930991 RepID=A0A0D0D909_9AGAM|nr:hypothetical protein PAXRUDRAFT_514483 [Paxillus rubicundulus Ve08.2h10]
MRHMLYTSPYSPLGLLLLRSPDYDTPVTCGFHSPPELFMRRLKYDCPSLRRSTL